MLVYRVFPYVADAAVGDPGHPLHVHPDQGTSRWDNRDAYVALYVATSPSGAIGETFASLSTWSSAMLPFPLVEGARRSLGTYSLDEERHPTLDFDDPRELLSRGLRPTDIVMRNRPRTQQIAREVFGEGVWAGLSWWSMHRPQWTLQMYWNLEGLVVEDVSDLVEHPSVRDAGRLLGKHVHADLAGDTAS